MSQPLSHAPDPEPSTPSAGPALPRFPAHRDAHSFSNISNPEFWHYFLLFSFPSPNHKWKSTSPPCELVAAFPRRSVTGPWSEFLWLSLAHLWCWIQFQVHNSRGFRAVSRCSHFTFWQLAKKKSAQGFFLNSFSFATWLKVDQVRLLSSLSWAILSVSNPGLEVTMHREEIGWQNQA